MSEVVLDASVLLALLRRERFDLVDRAIVQGAVISCVNLTEVLTRASEYDLPTADVETLLSLIKRIEPFTESQARRAAGLRAMTGKAGLSLGDRACIALGIELQADIYTTEHAWAQFQFGRPVILVRRANSVQ